MQPSETVGVSCEDPRSQDARILLDELTTTLALFWGDGAQSRFQVEDACDAGGGFVIARTAQGAPVGCGAFRRFDNGVAELKRIYSRANILGVGRAILRRLETEAVAAGYRTLVVETRASNRRAIAFYGRNGFAPRTPYGIYVSDPGARCFTKSLCEVTG
jgi:GNAT superfamily N-acetyltransferase